MRIIEYIASASMPAVVMLVGLLLLFGRSDYMESFLEGAREGLRTAIGLLPTLTLLICATSMLSASGVTNFLAALLRDPLEYIGIPNEILPLLLTRPFSGSASSAMFSTLIADAGVESFAVFCGAVIMGSSDTVVYILSLYFSSVKVKKTSYAFSLAFIVMIFCIIFSCFVSKIWFNI